MATTTFDSLNAAIPSPRYSRDCPLPASLSVREARDAYLAENGFSTDEYTKETFCLMFFGGLFKLNFPNPPSRKRAIALHDLHHVATGYGADFTGEGEIGVWELMGGCVALSVYLLNGSAAALGCFLSPPRMLAAYHAGRHARALYRQDPNLDELLSLSLGDLRERLGIPRDGIAKGRRAVAATAPRDSA